MILRRQRLKQKTDLQILQDWIAPGSRVLDLGCGRGVFLERLRQGKACYVVGVDNAPEKVLGCLKRGIPIYQADILEALQTFPDNNFDWVVCSRTLQALLQPQQILREALRVGQRLAVGFINDGYWRNRLSHLWHGRRVINDVFPEPWQRSLASNPININSFEAYCCEDDIQVRRRTFLAGNWATPLDVMPNLRAGYALYELEKPSCPQT